MFIDTFAWIEYFEGSTKGAKVRAALDATPLAYTSPMVLAELTSKYTRAHGAKDAEARVEHVLKHTVLIEHSQQIGVEAGRIHAQLKGKVAGIGLADCFILAAARSRQTRVLTGDAHFAEIEDAELL